MQYYVIVDNIGCLNVLDMSIKCFKCFKVCKNVDFFFFFCFVLLTCRTKSLRTELFIRQAFAMSSTWLHAVW